MRERAVNDVVILHPQGYLTGLDETEDLEYRLRTLREGGYKRVLLNLSQAEHFNSTGLGVLISAHSAYVRTGAKLKMCCPIPSVANVFTITKLSLVFDVYPTEEEALTSFAATTT
jgi:anti-sigma B factor antagonist